MMKKLPAITFIALMFSGVAFAGPIQISVKDAATGEEKMIMDTEVEAHPPAEQMNVPASQANQIPAHHPTTATDEEKKRAQEQKKAKREREKAEKQKAKNEALAQKAWRDYLVTGSPAKYEEYQRLHGN